MQRVFLYAVLLLVTPLIACYSERSSPASSTGGNGPPLCTYAGLEDLPADSPQCVAPLPPVPPPPPAPMCMYPGLGSIKASDAACVAPSGLPAPVVRGGGPGTSGAPSVDKDVAARARAAALARERDRAFRMERASMERELTGAETSSPSQDSLPAPTEATELPPATMQVTGYEDMRKRITSHVRIVLQHVVGKIDAALARADSVAARAPHGGRAVFTRIGDEATVCIKADTADFLVGGGDTKPPEGSGSCSARPISRADPAPWVFRVTPQSVGEHSFEVYIRSQSGAVTFDSTYSINVRVGSYWDELTYWVASLTIMTKSLTALLVALAAAVVAWRALRKPT